MTERSEEIDRLAPVRPARVSRRRAVLAVGVAGAVVLAGAVVSVVALTLPRHHDHPAPIQAPSVFPGKVGSERLVAEAVSTGGSGAEVAFDLKTDDVVLRAICQSREPHASLEFDVDGVNELEIVCAGPQRGPAEGDGVALGDLDPGRHTLRVTLHDGSGHDLAVGPTRPVGAAIYDASDRVDVAGADLERVVVIDGREWTPDPVPLPEGAFTPSTDVFVSLLGGRSAPKDLRKAVIPEIRLQALDPHARDVGSRWTAPTLPVKLVAGTRYRLAVVRRTTEGLTIMQSFGSAPDGVSSTTADGKDHIVVYRPAG